jgi:hypothetical protein
MLYAAVVGGYDAVVIEDLRDWTRAGDRERLEIVAALLGKAPHSFVFSQRVFVVELLERAAAIGQDCLDTICESVGSSVILRARQGVFGAPFPEDVEQERESAAAAAVVSRASPAWKFFDNLRRNAESNIRWKHQGDEEIAR